MDIEEDAFTAFFAAVDCRLHIALTSGRIAVKAAAGYMQDLARNFYVAGFMMGSRCGSLAVGASPVDACTHCGRGR